MQKKRSPEGLLHCGHNFSGAEKMHATQTISKSHAIKKLLAVVSILIITGQVHALNHITVFFKNETTLDLERRR
jgi:hypothetical protein